MAAPIASSVLIERALQRGAAEDLRRLDRPQARAVERAHDAPVRALLDRVGHRRGGDRRVGVARARRGRPGRARASPADARRRGRRPRRRRRDAAASAARTECERSLPPGTPIVPAGAAIPGGSATTISVTAATRWSVATDHSTIGRPARLANALGTGFPRRSPRPAATTSATANDRSYAAATFAPADSASRLSRCSSASVSSLSSAYISSEARIFFARVNICFSPVDRPF